MFFNIVILFFFFFSSRRRHTRSLCDWSSDVCSSDLANQLQEGEGPGFEVSGTGALPPLGDQGKKQARSQSQAVPNRVVSAPRRGALPSLANIDTRLKQTQPPSQSLVLAGLTSVLLATCVLLVWRARKARSFSAAQSVAPRPRQGNRPQPDWKL